MRFRSLDLPPLLNNDTFTPNSMSCGFSGGGMASLFESLPKPLIESDNKGIFRSASDTINTINTTTCPPKLTGYSKATAARDGANTLAAADTPARTKFNVNIFKTSENDENQPAMVPSHSTAVSHSEPQQEQQKSQHQQQQSLFNLANLSSSPNSSLIRSNRTTTTDQSLAVAGSLHHNMRDIAAYTPQRGPMSTTGSVHHTSISSTGGPMVSSRNRRIMWGDAASRLTAMSAARGPMISGGYPSGFSAAYGPNRSFSRGAGVGEGAYNRSGSNINVLPEFPQQQSNSNNDFIIDIGEVSRGGLASRRQQISSTSRITPGSSSSRSPNFVPVPTIANHVSLNNTPQQLQSPQQTPNGRYPSSPVSQSNNAGNSSNTSYHPKNESLKISNDQLVIHPPPPLNSINSNTPSTSPLTIAAGPTTTTSVANSSKKNDNSVISKSISTIKDTVKDLLTVKEEKEDVMERRGVDAPNQYSDGFHMIPWDQRATIPVDTLSSDMCGCLVSPQFWERVEWAVRTTIFCVMPTAIFTMVPTSPVEFELPGLAIVMGLWISQPTFGASIRELSVVLKGLTMALVATMILVAAKPAITSTTTKTVNETSSGTGIVVSVIKEVPEGCIWTFLAIYFGTLLVFSIFTENIKKPACFLVAATFTQVFYNVEKADYTYVGKLYAITLIGIAFATSSFFLPRINWSLNRAKNHCVIHANTAAVSIVGICSSFWAPSILDRELNLVRIRQLKYTSVRAIPIIDAAIEESTFEPHTGITLARVRARRDLLYNIMNIINSSSQLIEMIAENPAVVEDTTCIRFGEFISEALNTYASAMDSYLLKICNFESELMEYDIRAFENVKSEFDLKVEGARQEVMLSNNQYQPGPSDIVLGSFLFSVDEIGEVLLAFTEPTNVPSAIIDWCYFPVATVLIFFQRLQDCFGALFHRRIHRRSKEAFKLSISMTISLIIGHFMDTNDPLSGSPLIAWVYENYGAGAYYVMMLRVLGTVFGSVVAFMFAEFVKSNIISILFIIAFLTFCGAFVQTTRAYSSAGNAFIWGVISIESKFDLHDVAISRFSANVIAVLIYFFISYLIWPIQTHIRMKTNLDKSLRAFRECASVILHNVHTRKPNLILKESGEEMKYFQGSIYDQESLIPAAVKEPTMTGSAFPEEQWTRLVRSQKALVHSIGLLRFAFCTFALSDNGEYEDEQGEMSVHWQLIDAFRSKAAEIGDMIFASVDLYLMMLGKLTAVPTQFLVQLRVGLMQSQAELEAAFIDEFRKLLIGDNLEDLQVAQGAIAQQREEGFEDIKSFPYLLTSEPDTKDAVTTNTSAATNAKNHALLQNEPINEIENTVFSEKIKSNLSSGVDGLFVLPVSEGMRKATNNNDAVDSDVEMKPVDKKEAVGLNQSQSQMRDSILSSGPHQRSNEPLVINASFRNLSFMQIPETVNWNVSHRESLVSKEKKEDKIKITKKLAKRLSISHTAGSGGSDNDEKELNRLNKQREKRRLQQHDKEKDGGGSVSSKEDAHLTGSEKEEEESAALELSQDNLMKTTRDLMRQRRQTRKKKVLQNLSSSFRMTPTTLIEEINKAAATGGVSNASFLDLANSSFLRPVIDELRRKNADITNGSFTGNSSFIGLKQVLTNLQQQQQQQPSTVLQESKNSSPPLASTQSPDMSNNNSIITPLPAQLVEEVIKQFVLSNEDIHSVEAFVFGIRALITELGEFEKALLEMQHVEEINEIM